MVAVSSLAVGADSDRMFLGGRTSARQALRQLSRSELNQSESQPSPSATTQGNTKPQPQAHVQQHSALHDSSDDEILVPINLNAFTKALLIDGRFEPGAVCASISKDCSGLLESARQRETRKNRSIEGGPHSQVQAEINTPTSSVRTVRILVNSSGRRIRSAGSSVSCSKRFGEDSDAGTPDDSCSGKGEDLELPSTTRLRRATRVSGSLLSEPARRVRRRQTEEDAEQAQGEEPAAIDQPAIALLASNLDDSAALDSPVRTKSTRPLPQPAGRSVSHHDKENQAPAPARPLSLDTGSVAEPQRAPIAPERRAFTDRGHKAPCRPTPPLPPPKMSVVETVTAAQANKKRQFMVRVNGRVYTRIDCLGRGGSGKVYRVATASGVLLALKRVSVKHTDELAMKALRGEIELLKRMRGVERVIQLIDYEINKEKQSLSILMEAGELDFNSLFGSRQSGAELHSFDLAFVRYYWKEMLECVQAIHARAVVHSDLKPANFVLAKGRLKLIDFGIANAIQTDMTVNVYREHMAGTPNYMSPESLMDSNQYAFMSTYNEHFRVPPSSASRVVKVGKASDVWSLGCILYQMVYGTPPFGNIREHPMRIRAIVNWSYPIDFPTTTEDGSRVPVALIQIMRCCLNREQKDRPTCEALLSVDDDFLYPKEYNPTLPAAGDAQALPLTEELLGRVIQSVVQRCRETMPTEDMLLATWPSAYWASLKEAMARTTP
ncbi:kinase-like domain-containing protein [Bombardia bombarda]|uniref:Kinase-like domain-containing protein n=1 Tax=Bombardia bombarda TaxID=252184 RepID=A0AA39X0M7_9PEZI|nr:kinase-like domain-containing protein [Bombardia bombarda]